MQIDSLGKTKVETAIPPEHDIFPTAASNRTFSRASFLAWAALGEDAGGLDHHRPPADLQTHQHDAQIARFKRTSERTSRRTLCRTPARTCRSLGFKHATGRGRAWGDQRLAIDHNRLIDGCVESVSRMRRRARKRALQPNRDRRSLRQFRGGRNQRLARRNSNSRRLRLAIKRQLLRIGGARSVVAGRTTACAEKAKRQQNDRDAIGRSRHVCPNQHTN